MKRQVTTRDLFPPDRVTPVNREVEKILIEASRQDREREGDIEWEAMLTDLTSTMGLIAVDIQQLYGGPSTETQSAEGRLPVHLRSLSAMCLRWLEEMHRG